MAQDLANISDALSAPLGDLIAAVGRGLAEAQQSMDMATVETFKAIYKGGDKMLEELRQLGYQPTWYKIPELNAEISVSLTASKSEVTEGTAEALTGTGAPSSVPGRIKLYAAPMDANYTNRYDYDLKAASSLKFRIVPVPPSPQASEIKVVPAMENMEYGKARVLLNTLGVPYGFSEGVSEPSDSEKIEGTEPEAGEMLSPGQQVILKLSFT
ncbi:PASTA domain-containing protein [Desulfonema magnum]|uniref:PASTA domain-containing protein n=1 Tax=Desulfonema magnum TaxID=45655 RepID=A0A975BEL3_9BACT|nr:PASTA domain-containing protein [Desulfonema magnum]QTA84016.1 PASTA domain-containing protein [Desulfonema magnum]